MAGREFYVVIEKDEDGFYVGEVPQLRACYTQGRTLDELMEGAGNRMVSCRGHGGVPHNAFLPPSPSREKGGQGDEGEGEG